MLREKYKKNCNKKTWCRAPVTHSFRPILSYTCLTTIPALNINERAELNLSVMGQNHIYHSHRNYQITKYYPNTGVQGVFTAYL